MQQALYDALVKYVGNPPRDRAVAGRALGDLADAKTWTFHLVRNAQVPQRRPGRPPRRCAGRSRAASSSTRARLDAVKDFLKADGIKVVERAHHPVHARPSPTRRSCRFVPWWYVMNPKQVMANEQGGDLGQKWLTENEAGSGPFKIKRWQQGVLLRDRGGRQTTGRAGQVEGPRAAASSTSSSASRRRSARRCCAARPTSSRGSPPTTTTRWPRRRASSSRTTPA